MGVLDSNVGRSSNRDIIARAIENILGILGQENVRLFLPMWEATGTTIYDLLRPDLKFNCAGGTTVGVSGLMGNCCSFNGTTGYLIRAAETDNTTIDTWQAIGADEKYGQQMLTIACNPAFIRIPVKKVEAAPGNLDAAVVRVTIYDEAASLPNAPIANGVCTTLAVTQISTSSEQHGFVLATPPNLSMDQYFWVVVDYSTNTGVDANNYVAWGYDSAKGYGRNGAAYTGAWAAQNTRSYGFGIWNDYLRFGSSDFSIICAAYYSGVVAGVDLYGTSGMLSTYSAVPSMKLLSTGYMYAQLHDGTSRRPTIYRYPKDSLWHTYISTFSYTKSTGKANLYLDGIVTAAATGTATTAHTPSAQPFVIAARPDNVGTVANFLTGRMQFVIMTFTELSAVQAGQVSAEMLALRKYQQAV
jgi:hypothetical protein